MILSNEEIAIKYAVKIANIKNRMDTSEIVNIAKDLHNFLRSEHWEEPERKGLDAKMYTKKDFSALYRLTYNWTAEWMTIEQMADMVGMDVERLKNNLETVYQGFFRQRSDGKGLVEYLGLNTKLGQQLHRICVSIQTPQVEIKDRPSELLSDIKIQEKIYELLKGKTVSDGKQLLTKVNIKIHETGIITGEIPTPQTKGLD